MKFTNKIRTGALAILGVMGFIGQLGARENLVSAHPKTQLKTTATGCQPATAAIDLDINNVRARLMTGGDMWWNIGTEVAAYEIPKGSGRSSQFAASCWIGGFDKQGQLKVAAQTYRQDGNDYWPGALNANGKIDKDTCAIWDKFWKIDKSTVKKFVQAYKTTGGAPTGSEYDVIRQWPAAGNSGAKGANDIRLTLNTGQTYAPFVDANPGGPDGKYNPEDGDYPDIRGDQYIWWVFNDAGNVKQQSLTAAMGIEVQTSAFAYATQDFLNNSTFANYRVINRGALTIDSTYIAVWDDCDLGYYLDDYIGCDVEKGLGIQYNGNNSDGAVGGFPVNSYGVNPPQVGLDFFQGPKRILHRGGTLGDTIIQLGMTNFTYYNNDQSIIGNPNNGIQIYYYMTGSIRNGQRFSNDFMGPGVPSKGYGQGPVSNYVFTGDPGNNTEWSECACNNTTGDRRFIFSSGPFVLEPGAINDITFGCVWASGVGGCGATSFKTIKNIDVGAQALFDNDFKTVEGPEAPRMEYRALDRRMIFYLVNDAGSNNFGENYGNSEGTYKDSLQYHQNVVKSKDISNDSLYKFQGYRVFQLANSQVTSAEIFDPVTGEVDNTKAYEVFQCDVRDGVKMIVNYTKNTAVSDTTHRAQIKVSGKDSGIVHSFELFQDQFATTSDKTFINYHTYYFVAIAYAYNNFANFNPRNPDFTQDVPYLGSAHGAGGIDIPVVAVVPNPSNGDMGTVLNADYGSGVKISRLEGVGNGGNFIDLDDASMSEAVTNGKVDKAVYRENQGPINVKVVDPVKVPAYDWVLQINGATTTFDSGLSHSATWSLIGLDGNQVVDTIYSEKSIGTLNEQIAEKYGLSIEIQQQLTPGMEQLYQNGYIGSNIEFADASQPWLWGIQDQPDSSFGNWLRSGNNQHFGAVSGTNPCNFNDYTKADTGSFYQNMMDNFSPTKGTWGPYALAAGYKGGVSGIGAPCGFTFNYYLMKQDTALRLMRSLHDVNLVFTADKSKWSRCAVLEMQEDPTLAQGGQAKLQMRRHRSWNGDHKGNVPVYSADESDTGMSLFPGYAVDQNTGKRLNIVFGEDSYAGADNGSDMLWNPTSNKFNQFDGSIIFGGRHVIYILGSEYDGDAKFVDVIRKTPQTNAQLMKSVYVDFMWVGVPTLNPLSKLQPLTDEGGIIPNTTTLRFRVTRPFAPYAAVDPANVGVVPVAAATPYNPYYTFSTKSLAKTKASDNPDKDKVLSMINAVPNPYYGYSGYEKNRYDTKVRIVNLPAKATVYIYSLDGALVRTLSKNDANTSYIDWDVRNSIGLPISSGMYMMHVKADGLGEVVLRWFGAMRPLDVTTY